jgi:hypothetical protein
LREIAGTPRHLGARIGFLAVLHTWGQNLQHHPHVHCVVPGGGLAPDCSRWIACRRNFFLPVKVLSRVFRGKFLASLRRAYTDQQLTCCGSLAALNDPRAFDELLKRAYQTEWVVYAKPPFGGPEQVLKYLARYTHRVAISNQRLVKLEDGNVTFRWKNYAKGGCSQLMTVTAVEFIRRFLLHVLPQGFVRIRHFGFLCNRQRHLLELCRKLLSCATPPANVPDEPLVEPSGETDQETLCPACGKAALLIIERMARPTLHQLVSSWPFDTS